jgi:hydrogenase nickel incorporation protein HypA/HybF
MHELSVALAILDVVAEEAQRLGAARVEVVHLKMGPLSGVVKDALLGAYELAREGSGLDESRLAIEEVPIQMRCEVCAETRRVRSLQELCCEVCGAAAKNFISGQELEVTGLEIAT